MFRFSVRFNQCLSTWADKTPDDVTTNYMFDGTNCANKDANSTKGPWCQGQKQGCYNRRYISSEDPSVAPSVAPTSIPTQVPSTTALSCSSQCSSSRPTILVDGAVFRQLILNCINENEGCFPAYADEIGCWDVSLVTDMSQAFGQQVDFNQSLSDFNEPLNCWDVGQVTDMNAMFDGAISFNQPIDNWDVSKVTNTYFMFKGVNIADLFYKIELIDKEKENHQAIILLDKITKFRTVQGGVRRAEGRDGGRGGGLGEKEL